MAPRLDPLIRPLGGSSLPVGGSHPLVEARPPSAEFVLASSSRRRRPGGWAPRARSVMPRISRSRPLPASTESPLTQPQQQAAGAHGGTPSSSGSGSSGQAATDRSVYEVPPSPPRGVSPSLVRPKRLAHDGSIPSSNGDDGSSSAQNKIARGAATSEAGAGLHGQWPSLRAPDTLRDGGQGHAQAAARRGLWRRSR